MLAALADALRFGYDAAPWDGVSAVEPPSPAVAQMTTLNH
jgi:hypothetical protein